MMILKLRGVLVQFLVKYMNILNYDPLIKIITTTKTLKKQYQVYGVNKK